jgi:hypothetical protein
MIRLVFQLSKYTVDEQQYTWYTYLTNPSLDFNGNI